MLGLSAFAEQAFGATVAHQGVVVIVTGSGTTVSQGTPTYALAATIVVTGSGVTVSMGTVTFTMSGSVAVTGSAVTISTGAADVNVITWNPIDPDVSMTWTNIDPL
jgi:hypothetical protein